MSKGGVYLDNTFVMAVQFRMCHGLLSNQLLHELAVKLRIELRIVYRLHHLLVVVLQPVPFF